MKLIHKYLDEKKLVRGTYMLLLILVATTIIDFIDDTQIGSPYINVLTLYGHIAATVFIVVLLFLVGYIVSSNVKKIKTQYQSLLESEKSLAESEANLKAILNNTNTAYYLMDTGFRIVDFNELSRKLVWEETGKELKKGSPYSEYIKAGRKEELSSLYKRALAGEEINTELEGNIGRWYRVHIQRITNAKNEVLGLCIASNDITKMKRVQNELKDSEELYRLIFYNGPSPKWIIDAKSLQCLEVNEHAIRHYGYSREEFSGMTVYDLRIPETHGELKEMLANGTYRYIKDKIVHHLKKNGDPITVQISLYPIQYKGREALMAMAHDVTELIRLQEQLSEEKIHKQIEITKATIAGQEKERTELGKELHDNINQVLTSAKLYLETSLIKENNHAEFVIKGRDLVVTGINEIRKVSKSLVPPSLGELSLKEASADLVLPAEIVGTSVYVNLKDLDEEVLSDELKICVYRITQEALNNCIKYADAKEISISIDTKDNLLDLKIKDNGKGFDLAKRRNGIGITNMVNRCSVLGGKLDIDTAPSKGCTIKVVFELQKCEASI